MLSHLCPGQEQGRRLFFTLGDESPKKPARAGGWHRFAPLKPRGGQQETPWMVN